MKCSPTASSLPMIAMPLGMPGSSISDRMIRNAPPSIHSNEVRPCSVTLGMPGCDPVVVHSPMSTPKGSSAGFGIEASRMGPIVEGGCRLSGASHANRERHAPAVHGWLWTLPIRLVHHPEAPPGVAAVDEVMVVLVVNGVQRTCG